ncbi:MAG TPA: hypothetical protein DEQ09_07675 [Bacteroidales bacterium]|nr:hypothetical protein [Bacteroidales bacterium]
MIYKFVVISSEEESFLREFELDENNTLLDFHNILQEELEFDKSQMASFFTTTKKWEKEEEFTLFEMGANTTPMDEVIIDEIVIEDNQKLLYVFDMFNERTLFIECTGTTNAVDGRTYPVCTRSQGKPPHQVHFSNFTKVAARIDDDDEEPEDGFIDENDTDLSGLENMENNEDS